MANTNATEFRNILVDMPDFPGAEVEFWLLTRFAANGTEAFPKKKYVLTLDANGLGTQALPVPPSDAWLWRVVTPDGKPPYNPTLAAGADLQLTTWLASAQSTETAASLADQFAGLANFDAHVADTTAVHGIADTSLLETTAGAQAKADAAEAAAIAASEPDLGNPLVDGHVLSSTIAGVRSWVAGGSGGGLRLYTAIVDAAGGGDYLTLADALAASSAGDTIFIRNGTYAGGVTISLAGLTMIGESREGVIIQSPIATTPAITVSGARVTLADLKVDGRRDSQTGAGTGDVGSQSYSGIYVTGTDFLAQNIWVFEPRGMGITGTSGSHRGRILNSRIENRATNGTTPVAGAYSYGVLVTNTNSRWKIAYNTITGWSQGVGLWFGANECVVAFNDIIDNYGYLDEAHTQTRSATEDYGSTATAHGKNIWYANVIDGSTSCCIECAQGVVNSQFISNILRNYDKFADNTGGAFSIVDGGALERTLDITFKDNRVYGNSGSSKTLVVLGEGLLLDGNYFYDFTNAGIASGVVSVDNAITIGAVIKGNKFKNCRGGIYLGGSVADGVTIEMNRFVEPSNSTSPMINIVAGANHIINDNYFNANSVNCMGVQVGTAAGNGHRITNNTFTGFVTTCIDVRRGYCQISHNHCVTTNVFGAIAILSATGIYNNLRWNYCDANNAGRTIYLDSGAANNVVQENHLIGASSSVAYGATAWPTTNGNITTPNHRGTTIVPLTGLSLGSKTVGTSQATIAHGLPWIPREIRIVMSSAGTIWRSAASDATNIYLTADAAGRTCDVFVV